MEKRTAYVANYMDEGTWDLIQHGSVESWADAAFPYMHPLVLVADQPTREWLDEVKRTAVDEYLKGWDQDDLFPEFRWVANDPEIPSGGIWSQSHNARDGSDHLHIVIVVRRIEVAIA